MSMALFLSSWPARRVLSVLLAAGLVPVGTAAAFEWSEREIKGSSSLPVTFPESLVFGRAFDVSVFLKGNLHAHSNRSDGDSSPEEVLGWYREHGYAFATLTDHNRFSDPARWASLQDDSFHIISGEEISMKGGGKQVHVNALCTRRKIGGGTFPSPADALVWAVAQIEAQGGVALVNHPNFDRALGPGDVLAAQRAPLLEVMSGHPYVYSEGVGDRPSAEALWDTALAGGARFMGVAVDDMHHLRVTADPPASPGRGWVQVFGDRSEPGAVCTALEQGLLYASTGVSLRRIRVTEKTYTIWPETSGCEVSFIGGRGRILGRAGIPAGGEPASYTLAGGEEYVRAKVEAADGRAAWTPAVWVDRTAARPSGSSVPSGQK